MLTYKIVEHISGRINISIPLIKKLSLMELFQISRALSKIPLPEGIKKITPDISSGNILITYEPEKIDILKYIDNIVDDPEIKRILEKYQK